MFIITLIVAKNQYGAAFDSSNSQGGPSSLALRGMGGKWTPYIVDGEVWRLFTPIWLHAGVLHILTNLFFLLRFGWVFEERWGMPAFAAIYIIAGIGGCVTSAFATPENVSVGASGALFGLLGADIAYLFYNHSAMTGWVMELVILLIVIVINVAIGFAGSGVDNMAHLGGLLFGLLAGGCIAPPFVQKPNETMWRGAYAVSLVAVGAVFIALIWVLN
jgi:rhomboid protease GluP